MVTAIIAGNSTVGEGTKGGRSTASTRMILGQGAIVNCRIGRPATFNRRYVTSHQGVEQGAGGCTPAAPYIVVSRYRAVDQSGARCTAVRVTRQNTIVEGAMIHASRSIP